MAMKKTRDDTRHRRSSIMAGGLAGGGGTNATAVVVDFAASRATQVAAATMAASTKKKGTPAAVAVEETKAPSVGFLELFTFSTAKERWLMVAGLISAAIAGLSMPVWLLLLAESLEMFNNIAKIVQAGGGMSLLVDQMNQLIYSFAIVGAVSLFSGTIYVAIFTYTGERQTLRIREKFVKSAFRQEAAWFDSRGEHGDPQELPTLAANALARIDEAIGRLVADTFSNLLSAVGCLLVSLGLDTELALFMVCVLPIIAIAVSIVSCFMRSRSARALENFASAGAFATEVIGGIKTVSSLCAEMWAVNKYEGMAREAQKHSIYAGILSKLAAGIMGVLFYATYCMAFIFGTEQVAETIDYQNSQRNPFYCMINYCGISGAEVMVCIYGVTLCAQFFALMSPGIQAVNLGRSSAAEIFGTINRTPAIDISSIEGKELGDDYDGSIELCNVYFAYPSRPSDYIFEGFNLSIPSGSSVALVGPSGSGKSTISKLLLRLYDPLGGHVRVGAEKVSLRDLNLKWWRSQIGYVPQEPSLFPGTIRDNIARGKPTPSTEEEVIEAAKAACAHEFISELADGYDTFYSGSSLQISGGQAQRIAIARAIIRNPKILILDEATSALDTQSERVVQDALAGIRQSRKLTTVSVAHRLSTIISSDFIAVIADGCIQELGSHRKLFEEGGIYTQLCEAQGLNADSTDGEATGVETQGGWKGEAAVNNANEPKTKDEQPSGDPDDVDVEVAAIDNGDKKKTDEDEVEMASPSRLWQYNRPEAWYMAVGVVGALMVGALPPVEGILFGMITANFFGVEDVEQMRSENRIYSYYFFILAGASLIGNLALGSFAVSGCRLTRRMRVKVFEKMMRQSMGWFDLPIHSTGELTTRLEEDCDAVANVTGYLLGQRLQITASLLAGITISLSYSWQIGLIALGCMPLIVGAGILQANCTRPRTNVGEDGLSAPTILERGFHDIFVLQAYNLQDVVSDQYAHALKPDAEYKVKQGFYTGLVYGFTQFAVFCTFALLFYAGIELMIGGKTSFQDFFIALLAVMFAAFGVGQANADFSAKQRGLVAAAAIFKLLDSDDPLDDPLSKQGDTPTSIEGNITFKSVGFSYPSRPDTQIFYKSPGRDGFNLSIPAKQSVAFTGRSGCGKSTALQLCMRFYTASSGSVNLDDADVTSLNMAWLRSNMGYVGQMPVLFQGSVSDNIRLGKPGATEEEIVNACIAANAHEFITKLSDKYDTDIGAGGSLLSGGQKQRIAIARALIKEPKVLVLDEATSALDSESEKIVQKALDDHQKSNPRTTLIVAHKLETVKNADKIVVLDRGGVREEGSHAELVELKGVYYGLWKKQGGS